MIFCTIGTQAPFDRLLKIIDEIAPALSEEVIAQTYKSELHFKNIRTVEFLPPTEFNEIFMSARLIVAHAGMGTIVSALKAEKPIIIFPRKASFGEHRNEHQLATAEKMQALGYVYTAYTEDELKALLLKKDLVPLHKLGDYASQSLIDEIKSVIG